MNRYSSKEDRARPVLDQHILHLEPGPFAVIEVTHLGRVQHHRIAGLDHAAEIAGVPKISCSAGAAKVKAVS